VNIVAQDQGGSALRAYYVRVSGRNSSARFEGYVDASVDRARGFQATLGVGGHYDVLIVPDTAVNATVIAPRGYLNLDPPGIKLELFELRPGTLISGRVRAAGVGLEAARVRLRAGIVPSTVGTTQTDGSFQLRGRSGEHEITVLAPPDSGLPDAVFDQGAGGLIPDPEPASLGLDFSYDPLPPVRLDLTVQSFDGPLGGRAVQVALEGDERDLANVGTFTLGDGRTLPAQGTFRTTRTTDAGGAISFERLPRIRYRVTLVPPVDLAGAALTTTSLDLTAASGASAARSVSLVRKSKLTGQLSPAASAANLTVLALDATGDGLGGTTTAVVRSDGRFELAADPERAYRVFVEPPANRSLPRLILRPVRAKATDTAVDPFTVPAPLALTGQVSFQGAAVAGAVVQIFCVGAAPDCVELGAPSIETTRPLDETVSAADGSYRLVLPDPGP
jgi:hypothetical protein